MIFRTEAQGEGAVMRVPVFKLGIIVIAGAASLNAQWLNYPERRTPLTRDGRPDLAARAPRAANGKPDLSGVWQIEPPAPGEIERLYGDPGPGAVLGDDVREESRYFVNLFIDFKRGEEPITPEAAAQALRNQQRRNNLDTPTTHCLPYGVPNRYFNARPFKILQTPETIAMFFELDGAFRQIHTDGRKLPVDPFPAWLGYSTGTWEGDTLVVDTAGFNDQTWMDASGHPHSEALRVRERFHRRDFGHLDIEATLDDPKMLTRPFTVKFTVLLIPNSDVLESFCAEGERDKLALAGLTTQPSEPFLGSLELNLGASSITRGAPPRIETIVNIAEPGGFRSTLAVVGEKSTSVEIHHYKFDSGFHQTEGSDPRELSFKRVDPNTIEQDTRRNGAITVHRHIELSADGKRMTVTANGTTGGGQKYTNDIRIYEKK
jgi:hypothetical protein